MFFSTKLMAVLVDVHQDVVRARVINHLLGRPARDPFGRTAPENDLAVDVGNVGSIGKSIEYFPGSNLLELVFQGFSIHRITPS